jgi:hypothetical protein
VGQHSPISLGGFCYRVPIVLVGEPVEAVAADHLVRIFHRDVLIAEHVQRRKTRHRRPAGVQLRQGSRRPRPPSDGMAVTRVVDSTIAIASEGSCAVPRHHAEGARAFELAILRLRNARRRLPAFCREKGAGAGAF